MGKFNLVKSDAFETMQFGAGNLLSTFDPETGTFTDADIIAVTSGGITATAVATFMDLAEEVDNAQKNTKEFMEIDTWECKLATTIMGLTPALVAMALGCADVVGDAITPRAKVSQTDFKDVWWVGERKDGGMAAVHLMNALSREGFSLATTDKGNGKTALTLTGHATTEDVSLVPMKFYVKAPAEATP